MVLACDYLVLGAGARGIAFTDALVVTARKAVSVIIVDGYSNPGGMWNDIYPFAKLDQPSAFFQLSASVRLGGAQPKRCSGLSERASRSEVLAYCTTCMTHLIKNHSVRYFPNYVAEVETGWLGTQVCLASTLVVGKTINVIVRNKVVHSGYGSVPAPLSSRTLPFEVDPAVKIVRPHELETAHQPMCMYVVIGAGKTGLDTVLWLLSRQVPAETVRWVVPRDSWYYVAEEGEPDRVVDAVRNWNRCVETSESAEDLFLKMEETGRFCRIDEQHFPEIHHGLWVSRADLPSLRTVPAIRLGHVQKVATDRLLLEHGSVAIPEGTLCIDCTGNGRRVQKVAPIFSESTIKLQLVAEFSMGPSELSAPFCAAVLGFIEGAYPHNSHVKNGLCTPIPDPDHFIDMIKYCHLAKKGQQLRPDPRVACFLLGHPSSRYHRMSRHELSSLNPPDILTTLAKITPAVGFSRLQGKSDAPAYDAPTPENDEAKGASRKNDDVAALKEQLVLLLAGQDQLRKDLLSVVAENHELKQSAMVAEAGQQRSRPA